MIFLKKENWLINVVLMLVSQGLFVFVLAHFMKLYEKEAWYTKWQYWVLGTVCFFFPVLIMFMVFQIQMLCKVASKLEVSGNEIYESPYFWIISLIVPILGWSLMMIVYLYIQVFMLVNIYKGYGETYLKILKK